MATVSVRMSDSPCLKDIMQVKHIYLRGRFWRIGSGQKALFWDDKWAGESALCHMYPELYLFCNFKEVTVSFVKENWHMVSFSRWLHGHLALQWEEIVILRAILIE